MGKIADALRQANVRRVVMVDDDLKQAITPEDLPPYQGDHDILEILEDDQHEITIELNRILESNGAPHNTVAERVAALADEALRDAAGGILKSTYERAKRKRDEMRDQLIKVTTWIADGAADVAIDRWEAPRDLAPGEFYDLLVIDYYLVDTLPDATMALIKEFKEHHADQEQPLLVILTSSHRDELRQEFENIRSSCRLSASRFRILEKPTVEVPDEEAAEKWGKALIQLANERDLVTPIESFVAAWEANLSKATQTIIERLYDLDASALSILAATASEDSMSIDEYAADLLSRRITAETEHVGFPFSQLEALSNALLKPAVKNKLSIDQGVEVRSAQHAVRSLMNDVVWHRRGWWDPRVALPALAPGGAQAANANHNPRLMWMKRHLRFGTVLKDGDAYVVNLTQACDVQNIKCAKIDVVHYLFMRGTKIAIDGQANGEKAIDSSYYCENALEDKYFTLQWDLRRPFTPSMKELLLELDRYEWVGQLRNDYAYAVLAKFMSQATRVAQIRMPKTYRYRAQVFKKGADSHWTETPLAQPIEVSAWQREEKDWRIQFSIGEAYKVLAAFPEIQGESRVKLLETLTTAKKVADNSKGLNAADLIPEGIALVRLDASWGATGQGDLEKALKADEKCKVCTATLVVRM